MKRATVEKLMALAAQEGYELVARGATPMGKCGDFGGVTHADTLCTWTAGAKTNHPGWGRCSAHGGNSRYEEMRMAVVMGHALATELNVTPMEAMLRSVRVAAGQAAWYDSKIAQAPDDEAVAPGGSHWHWVQGSERAHRSVVQYSSLAIRAGISKILLEQVQTQAAALAPMLMDILNDLEEILPEEKMLAIRGKMRSRLLELDALDWVPGREPLGVGRLPFDRSDLVAETETSEGDGEVSAL
jgi:hypothetical protein